MNMLSVYINGRAVLSLGYRRGTHSRAFWINGRGLLWMYRRFHYMRFPESAANE